MLRQGRPVTATIPGPLVPGCARTRPRLAPVALLIAGMASLLATGCNPSSEKRPPALGARVVAAGPAGLAVVKDSAVGPHLELPGSAPLDLGLPLTDFQRDGYQGGYLREWSTPDQSRRLTVIILRFGAAAGAGDYVARQERILAGRTVRDAVDRPTGALGFLFPRLQSKRASLRFIVIFARRETASWVNADSSDQSVARSLAAPMAEREAALLDLR